MLFPPKSVDYGTIVVFQNVDLIGPLTNLALVETPIILKVSESVPSVLSSLRPETHFLGPRGL